MLQDGVRSQDSAAQAFVSYTLRWCLRTCAGEGCFEVDKSNQTPGDFASGKLTELIDG